jgi:hypothetical protein
MGDPGYTVQTFIDKPFQPLGDCTRRDAQGKCRFRGALAVLDMGQCHVAQASSPARFLTCQQIEIVLLQLQQDFLSQHARLLSRTPIYSDTQPNQAFVKLGIGIKQGPPFGAAFFGTPSKAVISLWQSLTPLTFSLE